MYPDAWGRDMAQPAREAALKPQAASLYPYLPARMWTSAARLAALVAKYRGICLEASDRAHRVLSDAHFMFRDLKGRQSPVVPGHSPLSPRRLGYSSSP